MNIDERKMAELLPKWLTKRYSLLCVKFKGKEFNHEQVTKTLPYDERMVSVILSEMRKTGWLKVRLDPSDMRKLYKLKLLTGLLRIW